MLVIFSLSEGWLQKYCITFSFARQSEKCLFVNFLCFFRSFSHRSEVIIEGVSNIIEIDYGVTIIQGGYNSYTGRHSFQRNKGFDSFPCVVNIIPICFKIFIIISLFTFLDKGGEKISILFVVSVKFPFQYKVFHINETYK